MAQSGFSIQIKITADHTEEAKRELAKAIEVGLTKCGMNMERYAKQLCPVGNPARWKGSAPPGYVGGTLRGSISYALDGDVPQGTYEVTNGSGAPGRYDTPAPKEGNGNRAVYVGTNVYYAPYVETGTSKYPHPRPFIEPSVVGHKDEHKNTIMQALEGKGATVL